MSSDPETLFSISASNPNIVDNTISTFLIGGAAAMVYIVMTMDRYTFIGCMRAMVMCVFTAWLTGEAISEYHLPDALHNICVSLAALSSDYILVAFMKASKSFFTDPKNVLKLFFGRWVDFK